MNKASVGQRLMAVICVIAAGVASAATREYDPYVPGEGLAQIAIELQLQPMDVLLDRRCAYSRTDTWLPEIRARDVNTCTLLLTADRVILAEYDPETKTHRVDKSFAYGELQNVTLAIKEAHSLLGDVVEDKRMQVQFQTASGYYSVTAWRNPPKTKPFDYRGSRDAFEIIRSKGVPEVAAQGNMEIPLTGGGILRIRR